MADTAVTRADRRRGQTRRALLDAGRAVIAERGVAGLTVAHVTETADVGRGSFYNHFDAKEHLVAEVARELITDLAEQAVLEPGDHADPALRAAVADQRFLALAERDPAAARLIVNLALDGTLFADAVRPYAEAIMRDGLDAGRFAVAELDMALVVLTSSALAVLRATLDGRATDDAPRHHAAAMLMAFGLAPDEAGAIADAARTLA